MWLSNPEVRSLSGSVQLLFLQGFWRFASEPTRYIFSARYCLASGSIFWLFVTKQELPFPSNRWRKPTWTYILELLWWWSNPVWTFWSSFPVEDLCCRLGSIQNEVTINPGGSTGLLNEFSHGHRNYRLEAARIYYGDFLYGRILFAFLHRKGQFHYAALQYATTSNNTWPPYWYVIRMLLWFSQGTR